MTLDLCYLSDTFNKNSCNYTILYNTLKSTMLLILTNTISLFTDEYLRFKEEKKCHKLVDSKVPMGKKRVKVQFLLL